MSIEAAKNFFKLIESNKEVAEKMHVMKNLLERDDVADEIVINKIILLAKEHGFDFTADEFVEYCSSYITELSDEELLNVSGGLSAPKSIAVGLALVFGTAVCATTAVNILHAVSESPSLISRLAAAPEKHHRYVPPQKRRIVGCHGQTEKISTRLRLMDVGTDRHLGSTRRLRVTIIGAHHRRERNSKAKGVRLFDEK